MKKFLSFIIITGFTVSMFGCAAKSTALNNAKKSYDAAATDPSVKGNAPVALYDAELALIRAIEADKNNASDEEVTHLSNVAQKRVEIAKLEAQKKQADMRFNEISKDRTTAVLEAQTQEVADAKSKAQMLAANNQRLAQSNEQLTQQVSQTEARTGELSEANKELQRQLSELKMKSTQRGLELTLHDTVFESGKAELTPGAQRDLQKIAKELKTAANHKILIEGHTDSIGSEEYNQNLSQRRAEAVKQALAADIDSSKLEAKGLGESYPVASNKSEAGRQQNRRVNIVILTDGNETTTSTPSNNDGSTAVQSNDMDSQTQQTK